MAVHKVPQDVEADDKFLGPLSFKQFLFFGGAAICAYLSFLTLVKVWPLSIQIFILPTLLFGALAFPWSREQPTELFLASRIRFLIKPRKRIWNQSGVKDLVNVTVPVREAHIYSDGLSQNEVRSRLSALATMVDSRGWVVKNIHSTYAAGKEESDRLVTATVALDEKAAVVEATPDVFDEGAGTIAKQFDTMIERSEQERKSATLKLVEEARIESRQTAIGNKPNEPAKQSTTKSSLKAPDFSQKQDQNFWFLHEANQPTDPTLATFQASSVIAPGAAQTPLQVQMSDDTNALDLSEQQLLEAAHRKHERDALQTHSMHEKVINPEGVKPQEQIRNPKQSTNTMTPQVNPDILNLARSNDLSVETIAHESHQKEDLGDDEVVISLH